MKPPLFSWLLLGSLGAALACAPTTPPPAPPAPPAPSASGSARPPLASSEAPPSPDAPAAASAEPVPGGLTPAAREQLGRALEALERGAPGQTGASCQREVETARTLLAGARVRDEDERLRRAPHTLYVLGARCAARAGDCALAWQIYRDHYPPELLAGIRSERQRQELTRSTFGSVVEGCPPSGP